MADLLGKAVARDRRAALGEELAGGTEARSLAVDQQATEVESHSVGLEVQEVNACAGHASTA